MLEAIRTPNRNRRIGTPPGVGVARKIAAIASNVTASLSRRPGEVDPNVEPLDSPDLSFDRSDGCHVRSFPRPTTHVRSHARSYNRPSSSLGRGGCRSFGWRIIP
jgi:hypothetical protein